MGLREADDGGADDKTLLRLEKIRKRHLSTVAPASLRTEILLDAWNKKTESASFFRSVVGRLIRQILRSWAAHDAAQRLPQLEALLKDISGTNPRVTMERFIKQHIAESDLAKDLVWLMDLDAKGSL